MAGLAYIPTITASDAGVPLLRFRQHQQLVVGHGPVPRPMLLHRGWAIHFRMMPDGRRQISHYYMPGDICGLPWLHADRAGQAVQAVCDVEAIKIDAPDAAATPAERRRHDARFDRELAAIAAIQSEHMLTLGRRTAAERLAQLFCEIHWRADAAGIASDGACAMPFTQVDLADICGLTAIHVNRMLQELRGAGMIELKGRRLVLLDRDRLARLAMFDPRYLTGIAGKNRAAPGYAS